MWTDESKSKFEIMYYDRLGMCGCGTPDEMADFLANLMEIQQKSKDKELTFDEREKARKELFEKTDNDTIMDFVFHVLDENGFMEHGGYVGNGWLTDDGKELLSYLKHNRDNNHHFTS